VSNRSSVGRYENERSWVVGVSFGSVEKERRFQGSAERTPPQKSLRMGTRMLLLRL